MEEQTRAEREEQLPDGRGRSLRRLRMRKGLAVLYASMGAMAALAILDAVFSMTGAAERELLGSAFEAFKLIAVTVLGYVFGANQTEKPGGDE